MSSSSAAALQIPSRMKAAQFDQTGDVDVIQVREVEVKQPGKGEILVKIEWGGVNFIDTYFRAGVYPAALPWTVGNEGAGVVVALGEGVSRSSHNYDVGSRVAVYTPGGSFAEYAVVKAEKAVELPEGLSTRQAAAALTQGLTALTFVKEAHEVKEGQFVLVQAAAGGLGLLLVQLAKRFGATVIGTTSTTEKAEIARKAGADHVLLYGPDKWDEITQEVYRITGGEGPDTGVHVVFDGVGKDTFEADFGLLRRKGSLVSIGNASGKVPAVEPIKLGGKNLKLSRPVLNHYVHTLAEFQSYAKELFALVQDGSLNLAVHGEYEFSTEGVRQTQRDITSRKTSGKLLVKIAGDA
ncbi:hypothetical protein JCM8547_006638 [Rhodosporidiobolus lusitaniae]